MSYTTDPNDQRLGHGVDKDKTGQNEVYLILPAEERAKGFVRPLRRKYVHDACGGETTMDMSLCETYARDPKFYSATYCVHCSKHLPVSEFKWAEDGEVVGS